MYNEKFKVIEILDEYSILINYGLVDGADESEKVRVLAEGPPVEDPETGESLGTLDSIKATLTIAMAYEKFSLCKKIVSPMSTILNPLSQHESLASRPERLTVDEDSISHKKVPDDDVIKVGDKVEIL